MNVLVAAGFLAGLLCATPVVAQDTMVEGILRAQIFNQAFEGFNYYSVTIEEDHPQVDGSREVTAVASGKFLDHLQRIKALFLIVGDHVIGGQLLEGSGLPPCQTPEPSHASSL